MSITKKLDSVIEKLFDCTTTKDVKWASYYDDGFTVYETAYGDYDIEITEEFEDNEPKYTMTLMNNDTCTYLGTTNLQPTETLLKLIGIVEPPSFNGFERALDRILIE